MHSVLRALVGATVLAAALAGCAGSGDDESSDAATTAPEAAATPSSGESSPADASPSPKPTGATPAPGDLLAFSCVPGADGKTWTASGTIVNSAAKADYRMTVLVAPPGVTRAAVRRLVIPAVETGVETPFTVDKLPVNPGTPADCRVQLVRLG